MKTRFKLTLVAGLLLPSAVFANSALPSTTQMPIQPDKGFYLGLQYVSIVGGGIDVGYQFNRNVALEVDGTMAFPFPNALVSVKGILPVSRHVNLYGKFGVGYGAVALPFVGEDGVKTGIGLGMGVYATKNLEFNFEANGGAIFSHSHVLPSFDGRIGISWHFN
jgi:hypothetical protein